MDEIVNEDHVWIRLQATERLADVLDAFNLFSGTNERITPRQGRVVCILKSASFEEYALFPADTLTTMGALSYSHAEPLQISIGRYCSIAAGLSVMGERHPVEWVTSSNVTYCFGKKLNKVHFIRAHRDLMGNRYVPQVPANAFAAQPVIEHDVWIGAKAQLARGITLHTGCVIGAGSIVTKDVPPYTIVAGVPAKPIRDRFSPDIAERLLRSKWWEYHPDFLFRTGFENPELFCDAFEAAQKNGDLPVWNVRRFTWKDIVDALTQHR